MLRRTLLVIVALAWPVGQAGAQLTVQILRGMAESVPIAIVPLAWDATSEIALGRRGHRPGGSRRSGRFRAVAALAARRVAARVQARSTSRTGAC